MKAKLFFFFVAAACAGSFFASCGVSGGEPNDPSVYDDSKADTTAQAVPVAEIKLTPFSSSPEFPDVAFDMGYSGGNFNVKATGGNYQLGAQTTDAPQKMCANSKDGQHAHLIIDNGPYDAVYTNQFAKEVADGDHYILGFLSRSYHESIKTPKAHKALQATVKAGTIQKSKAVAEPMLFYSRPKGKYVGKSETEKVMLDFYLVNTEISPTGNKVKVEVNGGQKEFVVDEWKPYFIEGLPIGKNKVKITLIDKDGKPVNCPLNGTEREFELLADPAPGQ